MDTPESERGGERSLHSSILDVVRQPVPLRDTTVESIGYGFMCERFQLGDTVLQLLLDTGEFRARALSYRGFNVAAGAWCIGDGESGKYGRVLGYNVKIDDTDTVNIHAEDLVTEKAHDAGFQHISVLSIIGPTQPDHSSGKQTETLHPCGRCRGRLGESSLVNEDTLIITARPDFQAIQIASLAAIQAAHDNDDVSGITTFRYPETPHILRPRLYDVNQEGVPIRIKEIDSSDYDDTVGLFLLQNYMVKRASSTVFPQT